MSNARELIARYFDLAPRPDADAYFAQFAANALVGDEGQGSACNAPRPPCRDSAGHPQQAACSVE
jgi:hypothetical protein